MAVEPVVAESLPVPPPVVLKREGLRSAPASIPDLVPEPRTSSVSATLEPDFLASLHAELHGWDHDGTALLAELPSAAPRSAPDPVCSTASIDPLPGPHGATAASLPAWSVPIVNVAPEAAPPALAQSSIPWSPDPDPDWSPDPVPPSDVAMRDPAVPEAHVQFAAGSERFASLLETAAGWPIESEPLVMLTEPFMEVSVDRPTNHLMDAPVTEPAAHPRADLPPEVDAHASIGLLDPVDESAVPATPPVPLHVTGRVQLGFRDGTTALLDPDSEQAHALEELALMLTVRH